MRHPLRLNSKPLARHRLLKTAQAIGDDMIQKRMQGKVTPEAFTHGTAAQRMEWLGRGYQTGDPNACDTFK